MSKIPADAQTKIDSWTKGQAVVAQVSPFPDTVVAVSKDSQDRYQVTACFTIGTTWNISVDAQGVTADEAFKAVEKRLS